jgi:hypothetical protein
MVNFENRGDDILMIETMKTAANMDNANKITPQNPHKINENREIHKSRKGVGVNRENAKTLGILTISGVFFYA